jgi:trk system potassium uptake protein TrkA
LKKKSFAVLGLGKFGMSVANTLADMGYDVLAVDIDEDRVNELSENVTHAVTGDTTDENLLKAIGIRNFDVAIVGSGDNMQSSILTTILLKDFGVPYIVSKAQNELHARVLQKVGANRIIFPEMDMGIRVAHNLSTTNVLDYIELSPENSIMEVTSPKSWVGHSLKDSMIREKFGINIIAIKDGQSVLVTPKSDYVIKENDLLVVVGANRDIQKLEEL